MRRPPLWMGIVAAAAAAVSLGGCAGPTYALDYVVFPNHEAQLETPPERTATVEETRTAYPIWGDEPPPTPDRAAESGVGGAGAEGCSVGLVGDVCELGILAAEEPLRERELLPPDGRVIQEPLPAPGER